MTREDGPITTEFQQQDIEKWQEYKEAFIVLTMFIFSAALNRNISSLTAGLFLNCQCC